MELKKLLVTSIVTVGVGRIPFAPGTWGSLVGVILWWLWQPGSFFEGLAGIVVIFAISMWAVRSYELSSHKHDPKEIVIDEVLGMWVTLLGVPFSWPIAIFGFFVFRFFDILKPFPANYIDREVPGALGTIGDDLVAGLMARLVLGVVLMLEIPWLSL